MFATRDLLEPSLTLFIWAYMLLANGASIRASAVSHRKFCKVQKRGQAPHHAPDVEARRGALHFAPGSAKDIVMILRTRA